MQVAVCDDEKILYEELCLYLNEYSRIKGEPILTYYFSNGHELLASDLNFDLIFMDYQMDDINGLETSQRIRAKDKNITIIFLTSYPQIVFKSFEVDTFRFLVKPIKKLKLFKALDDFLESMDSDEYLLINIKENTYKIRISQIIYVEAKGKHCVIRTEDDFYEINKYLKEIEKMLPHNLFIRTHRTHIVGFLHIDNYDNKTIYFDNGERGSIGQTYLIKFKEAFNKYIIRYNTGKVKS